jgi:serine/threonine protein kinase
LCLTQVDKNKIDYPVSVPAEAKEFIEALVQKDPALRPRSQDLLKYKFFGAYLPKPAKGKKLQ